MTEHIRFDKQDFYQLLRELDVAVCEASAVSSAVGVRQADSNVAYATHIFARICAHAQAFMTSVPESRWVKKDYDSWDLSFVAPHTRAILEGDLLFYYLSKATGSEDELRVKVNVMNMNDCVKRISFFEEGSDDYMGLMEQRRDLTKRLNESDYFNSLPVQTKKLCLNGRTLMIPTRDELLTEMGIDVKGFNVLFDFLSHYTHVLPLSYYRMEENGRGTGCFNETDMNYICLCIMACSEVLIKQTDKIVEFFPDAKIRRKGIRSKASFLPKVKNK